MSIKPWDKYQPYALYPSSSYPYGGLKQETTLGAGNGTPLDVDWGNDFEAFKQTAFSRSGLIPSGNPDTVTNSEMFNAVQDTVVRKLWVSLANDYGYTLVGGSFEEGATITTVNQCVWYKTENLLYFWNGSIPKNIPSNSSPNTTGGVSITAWQQILSTSLKQDLSSISLNNGDALITVLQPTSGTPRTQHDKNSDIISICDFGGKDDFNGTTEFPSISIDNGCLSFSGGLAITSIPSNGTILFNIDKELSNGKYQFFSLPAQSATGPIGFCNLAIDPNGQVTIYAVPAGTVRIPMDGVFITK